MSRMLHLFQRRKRVSLRSKTVKVDHLKDQRMKSQQPQFRLVQSKNLLRYKPYLQVNKQKMKRMRAVVKVNQMKIKVKQL